MNRLIITNGDSGAYAIRNAGIEGDVLSWDDVLHDGAVPAGLNFEELCERRIAELVQFSWGSDRDIRGRFDSRNRVFKTAGERDELICWFEHDLYDQLQLWQILDQLHLLQKDVSVICEPNYVTNHTGEELQALFKNRQPAPAVSLEHAALLWSAFRNSDPSALWDLRGQQLLNFADETIERWATCFPSLHDGLNEVERNTLKLLSNGREPMAFSTLFKGISAQEDPQFMGDLSFFLLLKRMASLQQPLVSLLFDDSSPYPTAAITEAGRSQLSGTVESWDAKKELWIGGVHLSRLNQWFFDDRQQCFTPKCFTQINSIQ
ncbi:hypothetical protein HQ496_06640 [bacterium]|nr:hypothetical protein [bacterium]